MQASRRSDGIGRVILLLAAVAVAAGGLACAGGAPEPPRQVLDTRVRGEAIEVDGSRKDWEGNLTRVGDSEVFAGFHRQGDALYVAVVSQDPGFDARVFASGLTVWFDTAGARRRSFGVRHPVFGPEARARLREDTAAGRPDRRRRLEAAGRDFVLVREVPSADTSSETPLTPGEAGALDVAAAVDRGLFTWEMRLPLGTDGGPDHALPVAGVDTISVGLQAGGDQGTLARPTDAGTPPDSLRGRDGRRGPPGRGGGRLAGPGSGGVPPMEIWVRVDLSGISGG